jgi:hypothetical protein
MRVWWLAPSLATLDIRPFDVILEVRLDPVPDSLTQSRKDAKNEKEELDVDHAAPPFAPSRLCVKCPIWASA